MPTSSKHAPHLLLVEGLDDLVLHGLPRRGGGEKVESIDQSGVEDGVGQGLEGEGDGLLLLGDGRILRLRYRLKHLVDLEGLAPLLLVRDGHVRVKDVRPPLGPPHLHAAEVRVIHVDDSGAEGGLGRPHDADGVGDAIGHRREALGPQGLVLEKARDYGPRLEVVRPVRPHKVEVLEAGAAHVLLELLVHAVTMRFGGGGGSR